MHDMALHRKLDKFSLLEFVALEPERKTVQKLSASYGVENEPFFMSFGETIELNA